MNGCFCIGEWGYAVVLFPAGINLSFEKSGQCCRLTCNFSDEWLSGKSFLWFGKPGEASLTKKDEKDEKMNEEKKSKNCTKFKQNSINVHLIIKKFCKKVYQNFIGDILKLFKHQLLLLRKYIQKKNFSKIFSSFQTTFLIS